LWGSILEKVQRGRSRRRCRCGHLGYDAVSTCRWEPTFRRNILPPSSGLRTWSLTRRRWFDDDNNKTCWDCGSCRKATFGIGCLQPPDYTAKELSGCVLGWKTQTKSVLGKRF
jgi:hypothetical protein